MRKLLSISALLLSLCFGGQAYAAGSPPANMTASGAIVGTQIVWCPTGLTADLKCTFTQIAAYINSLVSGDCIANGTGTFTCTKTNGVAFTALATTAPGTGVATALGVNVGSAGAFVTFNGALGTPSAGTLTNATGLPIGGLSGLGTGIGSWLATPSSANLAAALTDETGTGAAVFGTAPTISSLNATVAATLAFITGSTQCLQVNTSGAISGTGAVCGGSGSSGANPTATAADVAVNGAASTFMRSDAAPAVQKASSSVFGIVKVDGTTITAVGGVISSSGGSNTEPLPRPAYIANNWYPPHAFSTFGVGSAATANRITCTFGGVPNIVTINALGVRLTTIGTTNIQLAIYQDNGGVPGSLIGSTASIVDTSATTVSGSIQVSGSNTPVQVGPGGAAGNDKIWFCYNANDSAAVATGYLAANQGLTAAMGSSSLTNAVGNGVAVTGKTCSGAACQGGSSTFGTWPADLHTSTWSDLTSSAAWVQVFQVSSVP